MFSKAQTSTYLPALDGLRAIAILMVVISHAGYERIIPGGLGVGIFFVISGYLLTRQMIEEIEKTGTLNIKNFYLRRALRLMPALLLYVALICAILLLLGSAITGVQILSGLFYFANYYHVFIGYPAHSPMPILWSLSVEEHFYILFPLALIAFRKNLRAIFSWLIAAVIAALIWRIALYTTCLANPWALCGLPDKERIFGTDAIFDCILYGSITALSAYYWSKQMQKYFINQTSFIISAIVLLFTLIYRDELFRETLRFSAQSICIAILMLNILYGTQPNLQQTLSQPVMVFIGRLSYSLYLFHYGALAIVNRVTQHEGRGMTGPLPMTCYFVLTVILSLGSYQLVEKPMLKLRKHFGSHAKA